MTNSKPWVLGLTGGIASGKTTVSDYLASKGCLVADADAESRGLTAPGGAAMPEIERIFGADFIRPDGAMNRAKMRELVFSNDAARRTLESIIHPLVRKALMERSGPAPKIPPTPSSRFRFFLPFFSFGRFSAGFS